MSEGKAWAVCAARPRRPRRVLTEGDAFGFELGQFAHDPIGLALLVATLAHLDRRAVGVRRVNVLLGAAEGGGTG